MITEEERGARGLFRSVSTDGTHWLLIILPDDGWAVTRNGERIVAGTGDRASLGAGIRKFLALTGAGAIRQRREGPPAALGGVVAPDPHLDGPTKQPVTCSGARAARSG